MSVAYYIVLDQDIDGLDADVDGKALARHHPALEALAEQLGLPALERFVSIADDELDDLLGTDSMANLDDDLGDEAYDDDGIEWASAAEGLAFFTALADHLRAHPQALSGPAPDTAGVLADLDDFCRVLRAAAEANADFYLAIDF